MKINIKKSVRLGMGSRHNAPVNNIIIQKQSMDWKGELCYLGVYLLSVKSLKCNLQLGRQKYFRALKGTFVKIGLGSSPTITPH